MKSDYHNRQQRKKQRLQELADKNKEESENLSKQSSDMASVIPFGQPILVGHHSEKRDRNYRDKIHAKMGKSIEASQKASYYESRLEAMENNNAISSDDPDALQKLKNKLSDLKQTQEFMKACNKIIKNKKLTNVQKLVKLTEHHQWINEGQALKLLEPDYCGRTGFPGYKLTNNNANMKRIEQRIHKLSKLERMETSEITIHNIRIVTNVEDNRVQIFFPDIPNQNIRTDLKSNGFRWSPQVGAWQRQISSWAIQIAKRIVTNLCAPEPEHQSCDNCGS